MTLSKTRRQKLEAMANQTASPNEAAIAQQMLAESGTPLERISARIKAEWGKGLDAQFAIGRLLVEANLLFPSKGGPEEGNWGGSRSPFGEWFRAQDFDFDLTTAWRLREAALREGEVRAFISNRSAVKGSKGIGVTTAVTLMNAKPKPSSEAIPVTDVTPVDPAYAALRNAYNVILKVEEGEPTGNRFDSMHIDDFVKCFEYLKAIADAWQQEKVKRAAK